MHIEASTADILNFHGFLLRVGVSVGWQRSMSKYSDSRVSEPELPPVHSRTVRFIKERHANLILGFAAPNRFLGVRQHTATRSMRSQFSCRVEPRPAGHENLIRKTNRSLPTSPLPEAASTWNILTKHRAGKFRFVSEPIWISRSERSSSISPTTRRRNARTGPRRRILASQHSDQSGRDEHGVNPTL